MQVSLPLILVFLAVLCQVSVVQGRDSKDVRRFYTKLLRTHIYHVDRALIEASQGRLRGETRGLLQNDVEAIMEKLSPSRRLEFQSQLSRLESATGAAILDEVISYRSLVLSSFRVASTPAQTPDLNVAYRVYQQQCAACHGQTGKGDGKLALNKRFPMKPLPTNLHSTAMAKVWTPFSYYNLLLVGVAGTSMQAFDVTLTEKERWSLAFFLAGNPFNAATRSSLTPEEDWKTVKADDQDVLMKYWGSLSLLAEKSDRSLADEIATRVPDWSAPSQCAEKIRILRQVVPFLQATPRSLK